MDKNVDIDYTSIMLDVKIKRISVCRQIISYLNDKTMFVFIRALLDLARNAIIQVFVDISNHKNMFYYSMILRSPCSTFQFNGQNLLDSHSVAALF